MILPPPPVQVDEPSDLPVSVQMLADHLRVDEIDHEAGLLEHYLRMAVDELDGIDGRLCRALVRQSWRQEFASWPPLACEQPRGAARDRWRLWLAPVVSINNITAVDASGAVLSPALSDIELHQDVTGWWISSASSAAGLMLTSGEGALSVDYECGYGTADEVPEGIKGAVLMLAAHYYRHRHGSSQKGGGFPDVAERIIARYRRQH
ncbi:MAG: hypothetical protein MRY63_06410 [Neomegalonema sp.]|nr:hypothetical protein [Neomegalonema sp.]